MSYDNDTAPRYTSVKIRFSSTIVLRQLGPQNLSYLSPLLPSTIPTKPFFLSKLLWSSCRTSGAATAWVVFTSIQRRATPSRLVSHRDGVRSHVNIKGAAGGVWLAVAVAAVGRDTCKTMDPCPRPPETAWRKPIKNYSTTVRDPSSRGGTRQSGKSILSIIIINSRINEHHGHWGASHLRNHSHFSWIYLHYKGH